VSLLASWHTFNTFIDYSIVCYQHKAVCELANLGCCARTGFISGAKIKFLEKILGAALPFSSLQTGKGILKTLKLHVHLASQLPIEAAKMIQSLNFKAI